MRRLAALFAVPACAVAAAGCGGGGDAGSPREEALGYLPKDAPLVVEIDTDVDGAQYKNLGRILDKFPFADQVRRGLRQNIEEGEVSFERDVRPLLGNPFIVGAPEPRAVTERANDNFVGAIQVKDEDKLKELVEKEKSRNEGEKSGFTLYRDDDGDSYAVKEDLLVFGGTKRVLEGAIEQSEGDDSLDEQTFDDSVGDLPKDALVRVGGDLQALLRSDPETASARKVKWVEALRGFGMTVSAEANRFDVQFALETESGTLSAQDLPLASGAQAPGVVQRPGEVSIGLRDPSQIYDFALQAAQATNPGDYGQFQQAKRQIDQRLGVNVDRDIVDQLSGDTSVNIAVDGDFGVRAEVKDPTAMERTLRKIRPVLPRIAGNVAGGRVGVAKRGDFYALATRGGQSIVFGVVRDNFVLANSASRASRLAADSPEPVAEAEGALVVNADAQQVARQVFTRLRGQLGAVGAFGQGFVTPLGQATGSLTAEPGGLRGRFSLEIE